MSTNQAPQNDESQNVALTEWDGEGLPPVGVECEVTPHNNVWGVPALETRPCSVIAYHADFAWIDLGFPRAPVSIRIDKADFTPIRTTTQIAADEREEEIKVMVYYMKQWRLHVDLTPEDLINRAAMAVDALHSSHRKP